jgi:hypothetical protein
VAIEVTARGREREVCPFCRDGLAGEVDELFECPGCATRTHAACRREAGRCTTAGCTGPPPGAAAEAARRRVAATRRLAESTAARPAAQAPVPFEDDEPSLALPISLALAGLLGGGLAFLSGLNELAAVGVLWTAVVVLVSAVRLAL